ncbi:hypothetical protein HNR39_002652 [Glaciimonas immobilis]|uniref:Uncharacterized protein n=1 Tax=Glaciimonas immobilis TaxID=728004 RepID=A0A840RWH0_9BURK|nr:hypothetical protein [Glaciimonas immobilis]
MSDSDFGGVVLVAVIVLAVVLYPRSPSINFSGDELGCVENSIEPPMDCIRQGIAQELTVKTNPFSGSCLISTKWRGIPRPEKFGALDFVDKDNWKCSLPKSLLDFQSITNMSDGEFSISVLDRRSSSSIDRTELMRTDTIIGGLKHYWCVFYYYMH